MPKIAQYEGNQVQSRAVAQPRAQASDTTGGNIAVAKGVADVIQAGLDIKKRIDTTSAEEAMVQFERDKNDLFFNPDTGYFNTQGKAAYDSSTTANKGLSELKKKYSDTLGTDARVMFDRAADAHVTRSQADIARHASKGLKAWEVSTIESQVENSIEAASLYHNDPDRLKVQNILGRQAIIDASDLLGEGPETKAEKLQTFESAFASSTIEAATASSSAEGAAALESYGDRLEGPDKVKMEKAVNAKRVVEKTADDARAATLTATRLVDQYETRTEVMKEVNKIEDPELRKKTATEATVQFNRKETAEKELSADAYNQGIEHFNKGGTAIEFQASNPDAWEAMSSQQRNNLLSGKHMTTDQIKFNEVLSLPRSRLAEVNPVDYADQFKPSDLTKLRSAVDKAKKGQAVTAIQTASQKTNRIAEQFFGKKSSWQGDKATKVQALMTAVQGSIEEAEDLKGGKLKPSEVDEVLADFSRKFVVERSLAGFDYLMPDIDIDLSTTSPENVAELSRQVDTHGEDEFRRVVKFLDDNDKPVTIDTILNTMRQATK
jgi:hypothetical protein